MALESHNSRRRNNSKHNRISITLGDSLTVEVESTEINFKQVKSEIFKILERSKNYLSYAEIPEYHG